MHIQLAVHQSNTLLDTQWRPSQAMKKKNGGNPKAGTGPIVIPSSTKQNAPSLPRICRWNKLNLLEASSGDRGGFWLLHRFTTGSVMVRLQCSSKITLWITARTLWSDTWFLREVLYYLCSYRVIALPAQLYIEGLWSSDMIRDMIKINYIAIYRARRVPGNAISAWPLQHLLCQLSGFTNSRVDVDPRRGFCGVKALG